jgi:NADP-dependent 3-hydroxy acid dehydrogenase YdfG
MAAPLIVITGATHGIGRALAIAFAAEGHPLLLIARHPEAIAELASHPHRFETADVTDYAALAGAIEDAEAEFGPVDCLVNNAGFIHIGDISKRAIDDLDYETDVLLKGVLHGVRAVLPGMIERKRGTIVNVSSIGDRRPGPSGETYHAAKAAVRSLSESLQQGQAKNNIRVINLAPGLVKTNIHETMGISFEEYCKMLGNPDFVAPERIAEIILFCYKLPQSICIRDLVVMPTTSGY